MTIANNPKNQTSHAAQGSGQIIAERQLREDEEICRQCAMIHSVGVAYGDGGFLCMDCAAGQEKPYPAWVVVDKAGTDDEYIVIDYYTFEAAEKLPRPDGRGLRRPGHHEALARWHADDRILTIT